MKSIIVVMLVSMCIFTACKTSKSAQKAEQKKDKTAHHDHHHNHDHDHDHDHEHDHSHSDEMSRAEIDRKIIEKYIAQESLDAKMTESGLFYVVEKEGEGKSPTPLNKVKVHYRGTLLDGTEFDSSYKRGEPTMFPLGSVIKGWQEGIPLLKPGGKGKLIIPSELAYGKKSIAGKIPPHSVLVFDIELLEVIEQVPFDPKAQSLKDAKLIEKYLADNSLEAQKTPTGIHYIIEKAGEGDQPSSRDEVTVHYKGMLLNGKVFDSSYDLGEPSTFPLARVIKGWRQGIPLLKKGGKGKLIIPSALGYGPVPMGSKIPPNSVLVFEVELLDFTPAE